MEWFLKFHTLFIRFACGYGGGVASCSLTKNSNAGEKTELCGPGSVSFALTTGGLIKDLLGWGAGAQTRMNLWLYCVETLRSENIRLKQKS